MQSRSLHSTEVTRLQSSDVLLPGRLHMDVFVLMGRSGYRARRQCTGYDEFGGCRLLSMKGPKGCRVIPPVLLHKGSTVKTLNPKALNPEALQP